MQNLINFSNYTLFIYFNYLIIAIIIFTMYILRFGDYIFIRLQMKEAVFLIKYSDHNTKHWFRNRFQWQIKVI